MGYHSSFEKIIGNISEDKKEKLLLEKSEIFDSQEFEELKGKERIKTPEEIEIISLANKGTNEIKSKYKLDSFDVPPKNIHIVKERFWANRYGEKLGGIYLPKMQEVIVPEKHSLVSLFTGTFHEMIHFKSYGALQITKSPHRKLEVYRLGLMVMARNGENVYFTNLNEAVTEKMNMKYTPQYFNNSLIHPEIIKKDEYIKERHLSQKEAEEIICIEPSRDLNDEPKVLHWGYPLQRKALDILIDKLLEKNSNKFKNQDEVFEVFEKGMMTGNLFPVGRLIDETFGQGTLRNFGNLDDDAKEQVRFVNLL